VNGCLAVAMLQALLLLAALGVSAQQTPAPVRRWMFEEPLRVCYVSLVTFSVRCNGSPEPKWEDREKPHGPVPEGGWCGKGINYCGYDVDVWECVSQIIALFVYFQRCLHVFCEKPCAAEPGAVPANVRCGRIRVIYTVQYDRIEWTSIVARLAL
jgi:hypothetical protein